MALDLNNKNNNNQKILIFLNNKVANILFE